MEIKIRKKKEHPLSARHTTPIDDPMKIEMAECAETDKVDWNAMIRDFIGSVIKEVKSKRKAA